MNNVKEETVIHAEMTSPVESAAEPINSSRARLMAVLFAIGMLVLGLVGGWMLAGGSDNPATWGGEIDKAILAEIDQLLDDYWAGGTPGKATPWSRSWRTTAGSPQSTPRKAGTQVSNSPTMSTRTDLWSTRRWARQLSSKLGLATKSQEPSGSTSTPPNPCGPSITS